MLTAGADKSGKPNICLSGEVDVKTTGAKAMVLFVCFVFFIYAFSWVAEKKENEVFLLLAILTASFLSGFRAATVGFDTQIYVNFCTNIGRGIWSPNVELSFQYILKALLLLWNDSQWVLLVFALATNALIIYRFWTLRKLGSFSWMVLMYLVIYYLSTMNIMRQYIAIAIIFYSTLFLDKKKYIHYLIFTAFACMLHTTALLGFSLFPIYVLFSTEDKKVRKCVIIACFALIPVAIVACRFLFQHYYSKYLAESNNSIGLMIPVQFISLVLVWFLCIRKNNLERTVTPQNVSAIFVCALLGILITFGGYYTTTLSRLGLYFKLFEIPYIAYATQNGKYRIVPQAIYLFLIIYMLFTGLIENGAGVFPFTFAD